jgi:hypothetical protein
LVLCSVAGAAIAASIFSFDAISPLHAVVGVILAVVVLAKGYVLKSPQFLRSFTEVILGNELRRGVSIAAVVLGFFVGVWQRSLKAQEQTQQAQEQAQTPKRSEPLGRPSVRQSARVRRSTRPWWRPSSSPTLPRAPRLRCTASYVERHITGFELSRFAAAPGVPLPR